jgi:hypothetical protein
VGSTVITVSCCCVVGVQDGVDGFTTDEVEPLDRLEGGAVGDDEGIGAESTT